MLQQGKQSLLISFVEVRLPQGLRDEGILLLAHELGQRMGQGAPVALLTQGVQQDPRQVLGRHLAEREALRPRQVALPTWPDLPTLQSAVPLGGPTLHSQGAPSSTEATPPLLWAVDTPP